MQITNLFATISALRMVYLIYRWKNWDPEKRGLALKDAALSPSKPRRHIGKGRWIKLIGNPFTRKLKWKRQQGPDQGNTWKEGASHSGCCCQDCTLAQPLWRTISGYLLKLPTYLFYDPETSLSGKYTKEMNEHVHQKTQMKMLITASFTLAQTGNTPSSLNKG